MAKGDSTGGTSGNMGPINSGGGMGGVTNVPQMKPMPGSMMRAPQVTQPQIPLNQQMPGDTYWHTGQNPTPPGYTPPSYETLRGGGGMGSMGYSGNMQWPGGQPPGPGNVEQNNRFNVGSFMGGPSQMSNMPQYARQNMPLRMGPYQGFNNIPGGQPQNIMWGGTQAGGYQQQQPSLQGMGGANLLQRNAPGLPGAQQYALPGWMQNKWATQDDPKYNFGRILSQVGAPSADNLSRAVDAYNQMYGGGASYGGGDRATLAGVPVDFIFSQGTPQSHWQYLPQSQ